MENDVSSVINIGFDMIMGPMLRWKKDVTASNVNLDYDQFSMATYLAFKGGNDGGPRPQAIVYDGFSVVGFPKGLDLICVFLKNNRALTNMAKLKVYAETIASEMEKDDEEDDSTGDPGNAESNDECKRIICNMLRGNELSTPELRKAFELTNSSIWRLMGDLEHDGVVKRSGKSGRSILWTLA
ncbi:MAG: hypothetical protein ACFFCS_19510 [Candidatus Hodarchaeota archaeon]